MGSVLSAGLFFSYAIGSKKMYPALIAGACMTMLIEFSQLFTGRGLFEFDDMFNNILGVLIGIIGNRLCVVLVWFTRVSGKENRDC